MGGNQEKAFNRCCEKWGSVQGITCGRQTAVCQKFMCKGIGKARGCTQLDSLRLGSSVVEHLVYIHEPEAGVQSQVWP